MNQKQTAGRTYKQKTILILSVITTLFMGVMGYEMAKCSLTKSEPEKSSRTFAILSKQTPQSHSERKQYASINAQNQHLANKVLALKEQALETARRLHAVQLSVFAARKSHDQSIIYDLQAQLEEKEKASSALQEHLATLEKELKDQETLSFNMENTLDHLTEMLALQGKNKEKALDGLRSNLEAQAALDRSRLFDVIQDLEENQIKLKANLQKQTSEIASLEDDVSKYSYYALENEDALASAVLQYEEKQKELLAQAEQLTALLNTEQVAVHTLRDELKALQELQEGAHAQTIALQQQLDLSSKDRELVEQILVDCQAEIVQKDELLSKIESAKVQMQQDREREIVQLKEALTLQTVNSLHQAMLQEDVNVLLQKEIEHKEEELATLASKLDLTKELLGEQREGLALLKEERRLEKETLMAELLQKQEALSIALSKNNSAESFVSEQSLQLENLKEEIAQNERDLTQIRAMAAEQMQANNVLVLEIAEKQAELTAALSNFDRADMSMIEQQQELLTLKEQLAQREQEIAQVREMTTEEMKANQQLLADLKEKEDQLTLSLAQLKETEADASASKEQLAQREQEFRQIHAELLATIALKEENLAEARAQLTGSEADLLGKAEEILTLKTEIAKRESDLEQLLVLASDETTANQQRLADLKAAYALSTEMNIRALKEQMDEREHELEEMNAALLADNAQKEESLSLALARAEGFDASLGEVSTLKDQLAQLEETLAHSRRLSDEQTQAYQLLTADLLARTEQFAAAEEVIASLQTQMIQREQQLQQLNLALTADLALKEEKLASALSESKQASTIVREQQQELATLEESLANLRETTAAELNANHQLIASMVQKQEELTDTLAKLQHVEMALTTQQQETIAIREQMALREQALMQVNTQLLADVAQKEENLSLALARIENATLTLDEQAQAMIALQEQMTTRELELDRLRTAFADEGQNQIQLSSELSEAVTKISNAEILISEQDQEIAFLKAREENLLAAQSAILADVAQKEESLSLALSKLDGSTISLAEQEEALSTLRDQITQRELELAELHEMATTELAANEQLLADIAEKEELISTLIQKSQQSDAILHAERQEFASFQNQTREREQELQATLNTLLAKKEESDILMSNQAERLQILNEQIQAAQQAISSSNLAKTELSNELKNLQHELITAFGKIDEMDTLASTQKQQIEALASQLELTKETATAADTQKSLLMEEIVSYKDALINALTSYENAQKRAENLEQQLSTYQNQDQPAASPDTEEELKSLMKTESSDDQASLDTPLMG